MFQKIKDFLYAVVHASGRLFEANVEFGPFRASLWLGRDNPDGVSFAISVDFDYGPYVPLALAVEAEAGVIKAAFYLTKNDSG